MGAAERVICHHDYKALEKSVLTVDPFRQRQQKNLELLNDEKCMLKNSPFLGVTRHQSQFTLKRELYTFLINPKPKSQMCSFAMNL